MSRHAPGWPDLLLFVALGVALNGRFYTAMTVLAVYAVLYHRALRRYDREQAARSRATSAAREAAVAEARDYGRPPVVPPFTREDIARIYGVPLDVVSGPTRPQR